MVYFVQGGLFIQGGGEEEAAVVSLSLVPNTKLITMMNKTQRHSSSLLPFFSLFFSPRANCIYKTTTYRHTNG